MKFTSVTWYSQLLAIVLGIGIFGLGVYVGSKVFKEKTSSIKVSHEVSVTPETNETNPSEQIALQTKVVSLQWRHEVVQNTTEYPQTLVTLMVRREGKVVEFKDIATVDGSCNLMPTETLLALDSEQLLCYYAGFGYQYRVIDDGVNYMVQQKEIEEASPDYNPPIAEFKTILTLRK